MLPRIKRLMLRMARRTPANAQVDRLLSAHREVLDDHFSLCDGRSYLVLENRAPLARGMQVVYRGTQQQSADRGRIHLHRFELEDGQLLTLPLNNTPRTVADSLVAFSDIEHPETQTWRNLSLMLGLYHRAKRIREFAAATVTQDVVGVTDAVPRLYALALAATDNSPFSAALQRVAVQAIPLIAKLDDTVDEALKPASENILALLGSKRHMARYREDLLSSDLIRVRRAIKRLAQIGDRLAEPRLRSLQQHHNMNVRFAVREALAKLAQLEA